MIKKTHKELKQYYKSISNELICSGKKKRQILMSIKDSIACYISENPETSIDDIKNHFGTATEIADEYYNNESTSNLKAKVTIKKIIIITVIVALAIALLIYIASMITLVITGIEEHNGYGVEYIDIISSSDH